MKKYIITIGCALVAQITYAEDGYEWADRLMRESKQFQNERNERELQQSVERLERQNERIERQLEAAAMLVSTTPCKPQHWGLRPPVFCYDSTRLR